MWLQNMEELHLGVCVHIYVPSLSLLTFHTPLSIHMCPNATPLICQSVYLSYWGDVGFSHSDFSAPHPLMARAACK